MEKNIYDNLGNRNDRAVWLFTPSHAYLKVLLSGVTYSGFKPSKYSYKNLNHYYLEEDCDAIGYLSASLISSLISPLPTPLPRDSDNKHILSSSKRPCYGTFQKEKITTPQYVIEAGKTKKMLKKGKISIDKKIDFHGKILSEAEDDFQTNILESYKQKRRCLLFVTGKGLHKQKNIFDENLNKNPKLFYGKIREAFLEWVKKPELAKYILSIEKADFEHGGDGAFFVYLRKNRH